MRTVEQALYGALAGDSSLSTLAPGGVWRNVAPVGTKGVWVVYSWASEVDTYTFTERAYCAFSYQVKAVAPGGSAGPAWAAAERIEDLLTDQPIAFDGSLMELRREQVVSLTENDGGELFQHCGGFYRVTVQEA